MTRRTLLLVLLFVASLPAHARDLITECGTYEMEGYFVFNPNDLKKKTIAIVIEKNTLSETLIVLGAYDEKTHEDYIGTKVRAKIDIEIRCREAHCNGRLTEDPEMLEPWVKPRPFFFPKQKPENAKKCRPAPALPWL